MKKYNLKNTPPCSLGESSDTRFSRFFDKFFNCLFSHLFHSQFSLFIFFSLFIVLNSCSVKYSNSSSQISNQISGGTATDTTTELLKDGIELITETQTDTEIIKYPEITDSVILRNQQGDVESVGGYRKTTKIAVLRTWRKKGKIVKRKRFRRKIVEFFYANGNVAPISDTGLILQWTQSFSNGVPGEIEETENELAATLTGVSVSGGEPSIVIKKSTSFTATPVFEGEGHDSEGVTFTWSSSDDKIATVSEDGTVTGIKEGEVTITVEATHNGISKSTTTTVKIKKYSPEVKIEINADSISFVTNVSNSTTITYYIFQREADFNFDIKATISADGYEFSSSSSKTANKSVTLSAGEGSSVTTDFDAKSSNSQDVLSTTTVKIVSINPLLNWYFSDYPNSKFSFGSSINILVSDFAMQLKVVYNTDQTRLGESGLSDSHLTWSEENLNISTIGQKGVTVTYSETRGGSKILSTKTFAVNVKNHFKKLIIGNKENTLENQTTAVVIRDLGEENIGGGLLGSGQVNRIEVELTTELTSGLGDLSAVDSANIVWSGIGNVSKNNGQTTASFDLSSSSLSRSVGGYVPNGDYTIYVQYKPADGIVLSTISGGLSVVSASLQSISGSGVTSDGGSSATSTKENPAGNETVYSYEDVVLTISGSGLTSLPHGYWQNRKGYLLSRGQWFPGIYENGASSFTVSKSSPNLYRVETQIKDDFGRRKSMAIKVVILQGGYTLDDAKKIMAQVPATYTPITEDQKIFDAWYFLEKKDMQWIDELPNPTNKLTVKNLADDSAETAWKTTAEYSNSTWVERVYNDDGNDIVYFKMPSEWKASKDYSKTFHPGAEMNIRTASATSNGYGHQATYDIDGNIIKTGLAAGSADYRQAGGLAHVSYDVDTFELAADLDGNDISYNILFPNAEGTPPTILGDNLKKYFEVRPPHTD